MSEKLDAVAWNNERLEMDALEKWVRQAAIISPAWVDGIKRKAWLSCQISILEYARHLSDKNGVPSLEE